MVSTTSHLRLAVVPPYITVGGEGHRAATSTGTGGLVPLGPSDTRRPISSGDSVLEADAIAVRSVLAGDKDAFRVLVDRYRDSLINLAHRMTGSASDAEDIA